ncbi:hypothetical protein NDU88_004635 [Pleurodeles waltl]|uniref:Uncharacterized protein n=1 Tax=Pleurodeles waltl TaxID=8319 RepID=A0AAV7RJU4_PLEWA|nr:hypothetical protein NDU88_004635 [Pleurodeles waltl]
MVTAGRKPRPPTAAIGRQRQRLQRRQAGRQLAAVKEEGAGGGAIEAPIICNWNNWGESLCCTPFSKKPSQVENDTDCIIIEEFPLIDLSDACSDTPQGTQIAHNKTKMRSTCSTSSPRKDLSSCNITTTTTFDTHVSSAVIAMEQPEKLEELEDLLDHTTGAKANVEPSTSGDSWKALLATMDAISAAIQF